MLFPSLMGGVSWVKREGTRRPRTNTNYRAIFGLFVFNQDGGWTEKNKSKEEEERQGYIEGEKGTYQTEPPQFACPVRA